MITQEYFLDMIPGESTPPVVHVSQFDVNSRTLTFNLMKGGVAFVPDAGMTVTLDGMKPDNHVFSYPMTVNGSSVSIDVLTQMTVVAGHVRCEVSVSNQTGKIGSANFILAVEESPIDSGSISESDIPIFEDLKNQAQQAAADAEQSASDAESAASSVYAILPESAGTAGQVLTKTATGADWETIDATDIETSSGVAIKSVSGNPVTITNALQGNALGVTATLEPIQDLHGYDHPWAGGAGKNLANLSEATGGTVTGESVTVQGGTASYQAAYILMNLKGGTTYTFSARATRVDDSARISFRNVGNNQNVAVSSLITSPGNLSVSYTPPSDVDMRLSMFATYGTANPDVATVYEDIQIEESSEPTAYEPYSNICPISGRTQVDVNRTGKNLLKTNDDLSWRPSLTKNADGSIQVVGSRTSSGAYAIGTVDLKANTNYVLSASGNDDLYYQMIVNGSTAGTARLTDFAYTPTEDVTATIRIFARENIDFNEVLYPQLELGSTATEYEPYQEQSVTVNLGQTVYGGTLDVTTGLLTVEKGYVDLGTLDWQANGDTGGFREFAVVISDKANGITNMMCSALEVKNASGTSGYKCIRGRATSGNISIVWDIVSVADFKTAVSGYQLVYELATPQTIQLSPAQINLLTGTNIITTNADNLSVMYYATGKGDVEGSLSFLLDKTAKNEMGISSLAGSLAMVETSPATANHAVGSYLMLNNRLCKVTVAIATGEQIIVGSNAQYTTVAEELAAILAQINA